MKLAILSPLFPFSGRVPLVPPILEYLGALTLREAPATDLLLIDANQRDVRPEEIAADTVAISVMTATAPWSYRFADACRKLGKRVVLGGIHPSALPEEASLHADAVVVGEAESVWGNVLSDLERGSLNRFYRGERQSLDNLPRPMDGKLTGNYQFRAFFTMRGCPYRCTFCSVRRFFGDTIRYRPIADVALEIEDRAGRLWFNGDDNIWGGDPQRSIALFDELSRGGKRHWYGFGDLRSIQGETGGKMLEAARRSGLFSVWVGWEGEEQYLGAFNASGKQGTDRETSIRRMQDAGIDVTLFVVLGGRQDSIDSFKRTLELSERLQVGIHPVLLTPLPGTELYDAYREHLLPDLGWEWFTGVRSVFDHPSPDMSPRRREEEYHRLSNELFRFERIAGRIGRISSKGFPSTHLYSLMMQLPMKHALSKAYAEWKAEECIEGHGGAVTASAAGSPAVKCTPGMPSVAGLWTWIAFLAVVSVVDLLEARHFQDSVLVDRLEILLFLNAFMVVLADAIINRRRWYRAVDILINWTRDGNSRKSLLLREGGMAALLCCGQFWAYLCAFYH